MNIHKLSENTEVYEHKIFEKASNQATVIAIFWPDAQWFFTRQAKKYCINENVIRFQFSEQTHAWLNP